MPELRGSLAGAAPKVVSPARTAKDVPTGPCPVKPSRWLYEPFAGNLIILVG